MHNDHVVSRIWNKDHTVWASSNDVIQNSLGWLDISERIREYIPSLKKFALDEVDSGCEYIVLIGMGASSIGADVLNESFGNRSLIEPLLCYRFFQRIKKSGVKIAVADYDIMI